MTRPGLGTQSLQAVGPSRSESWSDSARARPGDRPTRMANSESGSNLKIMMARLRLGYHWHFKCIIDRIGRPGRRGLA